MSDALLKAIYEQKRTGLLLGYLSGGEGVRRAVDPAYVFAWLHRMSPLGLTTEETVFDPVYDIPTKSVQGVFAHLSEILDRGAFEELHYRTVARAMRSEEDPRLGVIISYFILRGLERNHKAFTALQSDVLPGHAVTGRFGPDYIQLPS